MTMGRPSSYDPGYCEAVVQFGKEGDSKVEMAVKLNVSRQTLYYWMDDYPDFFDAMKRAEEYAAAWHHTMFKKMATGQIQNANPTALIFNSKNQCPDEFRDRREVDIDGKVGVFEIDFTGYDEDTADEPEAE